MKYRIECYIDDMYEGKDSVAKIYTEPANYANALHVGEKIQLWVDPVEIEDIIHTRMSSKLIVRYKIEEQKSAEEIDKIVNNLISQINSNHGRAFRLAK